MVFRTKCWVHFPTSLTCSIFALGIPPRHFNWCYHNAHHDLNTSIGSVRGFKDRIFSVHMICAFPCLDWQLICKSHVSKHDIQYQKGNSLWRGCETASYCCGDSKGPQVPCGAMIPVTCGSKFQQTNRITSWSDHKQHIQSQGLMLVTPNKMDWQSKPNALPGWECQGVRIHVTEWVDVSSQFTAHPQSFQQVSFVFGHKWLSLNCLYVSNYWAKMVSGSTRPLFALPPSVFTLSPRWSLCYPPSDLLPPPPWFLPPWLVTPSPSWLVTHPPPTCYTTGNPPPLSCYTSPLHGGSKELGLGQISSCWSLRSQ